MRVVDEFTRRWEEKRQGRSHGSAAETQLQSNLDIVYNSSTPGIAKLQLFYSSLSLDANNDSARLDQHSRLTVVDAGCRSTNQIHPEQYSREWPRSEEDHETSIVLRTNYALCRTAV